MSKRTSFSRKSEQRHWRLKRQQEEAERERKREEKRQKKRVAKQRRLERGEDQG